MDNRRIGLLGGMHGLAALAALYGAPTMDAQSMRIIQPPTAKRSREKSRTQGRRADRKDKAFKLKGIRP